MKALLKTSIALLLAVVTISCNQKAENKTTPNEEIHHDSDHQLSLNDGKQWIANSETTEGVNQLIKTMNSFNDTDNIEAYRKLSKDLQIDFNLIFEKCTMKGEAHNQLHTFLVPMTVFFETFRSSDLKECQESYAELNKHLMEYKTYFKS